MPYTKKKNGDEWCVYKKGADGEPEGDTLGCHPSEAEADAQIAAIHANEDKSLKVGRRNSAVDLARIQAAHDTLYELGAECKKGEGDDDKSIDLDKTMVAYGGDIKALGITPEGNVHVGGYLVRFSDENTPDLTGDYFTKDTDFGFDEGEEELVKVYFNHGQPMKTREKGDIIITRKIGRGRLQMDDVGLLIDAIIFNHDEYEAAIGSQVPTKKLGWSSGALSHLVDREFKGNTGVAWIKKWIIGEASLTPTPAEPRNSAVPLKSLLEIPATAEKPTGEPEAIGEIAASGGSEVKAVTQPINPTVKKEAQMPTEEVQTAPTFTLEDVKKAIADEMKAFAEKLPTNGNGGVAISKDKADQPWESQGQFYKSVINFGLGRSYDDRLNSCKGNPTGLGESVPADGGFLIPPQYAPGIIENMHSGGEILSRVTKDSISGNRMILNGIDETTRVDGSRNGGIRGYWVSEAGSITASKPKFRQVDLKLNKVAALVYLTDEIIADQGYLNSYLGRAVPDELRFKVEDAIMNGDGVGKPQGILNANALVSFVRDTSLLIAHTDLVAMWARRATQYKDYFWFSNQDVTPALNSLVLASSTEEPLRFIGWGSDGIMTIFGRPVIETEFNPTYKDQGDLLLAAPSAYQFLDHGGVESASSIHVEFLTGQEILRFTYRCDGASLWSSALTPFKGSNTISPFVALTSATT